MARSSTSPSPRSRPQLRRSRSAEEKGEDAAGDSTTDEDVDRSEDAADTDVEPEEDTAAGDTEAESSTEGGLGGKYPEGQSMFDVPDDEAASEEPPAEEEPDDDSSITSLKDIKAKYSADEPADDPAEESTEGPTEDSEEATAEEEVSTEDEPAEEPEPVSSGETHQPKTDKDIGEAGSLFDL